MLMNLGLMEFPDDCIVLFNFHKRFQINIGDAGGFALDGKKQIDILLAEFRASDFPHAFANRRNTVQFPIIVTKLALQIAFVCFPDCAQARSKQAGTASLGKFSFVSCKVRSVLQRFQICDVSHQLIISIFYSSLDLRKGCIYDFLLMGHQFLILRQ
jgi:hypothetical protein